MKQFFKQLLAGTVGAATVAIVLTALYWVARGILWVSGFVNIQDINKNWGWIGLGMLLLAAIELLGVLVLKILRMCGAGGRKYKTRYESGEFDDEET